MRQSIWRYNPPEWSTLKFSLVFDVLEGLTRLSMQYEVTFLSPRRDFAGAFREFLDKKRCPPKRNVTIGLSSNDVIYQYYGMR